MPQLLLELFSEEIPARMQANAARDLERLFVDKLKDAGLEHGAVQSFAGPRRLTLVIDDLPVAQADRTEERKGPRANAPEQALEGFLRSTGLTRDQLVERDGVLFANIARKGRPTPQIVAEITDQVVRGFPWPKSMTWGAGSLRWVRPLKRILCLFDGAVVPFAIDGIQSGDVTEGHRFMGSGQSLTVASFDAYKKVLADNFVVLDAEDRKRTILDRAAKLCAAAGLELVPDEGLLNEVAGLAEWPTPILGEMDASFLDLPAEVIRTSMRTHQKYFAVRDPKTAGLAPRFLAVANIEATDGGKAIAAGNARVLSARLNDARFFWDEDQKAGNFDRWLARLEGVTFHAKLGTMAERVARISHLAHQIAPDLHADLDKAKEAGRLAKADLASGMVGEFPELQGLMGGYYARIAGADPQVADAVRDHYKPQGNADDVPTAPVSMAVALADKFDSLIGFFSIDERPTGSRDPYGLRRAALGIIRIILTNRVRLTLNDAISATYSALQMNTPWKNRAVDQLSLSSEVTEFFADRLKVLLREQGKRHDLVDAVFALGDDDLVRIVARVEALDQFLKTDDGANLLAGYRRAVNILKAEAKKNPGESYEGDPDPALFRDAEERALAAALDAAVAKLEPQLASEDFTGAGESLAGLRGPVDAFFDKVLVNDPDAAVRMNRLRLLSRIRDAAGRVADFALIGG
ncbi:MAG TPA: glycine--tRNA ligase subunit beta [Caulobacteraceae bacterium]|jgi:glycyl-tRNA synthetase beta chain|nr:glycine--tRNA ligase subunit beta [Caulobacteraceae bacterium]